MQEERSPSHRRYWLAAMFLTVMFGFAAYRHSNFAVWNDSGLYRPRTSKETAFYDGVRERFHRDPLTAIGPFSLKRCFLSTGCGGCRPLTELLVFLASVFLYTPSYLPLPLLLLDGAVLGALAVSLFYVARRFVRHDLTALGAVLLVLGSPPLVGSAWVCVAGVQSLVPLLFCLSLLCYWNLIEGRHKVLWSTGLILLLLLGPWVREFFGLNALLLMFLEWRRTRRPTWIMGTAALGFLHALFPTALVHWLFLPELPLLPVYKIGLLSGQLDGRGIHWDAPWHFLPLFPPSLWVCAGLEALLRLRGGYARAGEPREDWFGRIEAFVQRLGLPCCLLAILTLFVLDSRQAGYLYHGYLGLTLCLGLAALGIQRDLFLGCWFVLMYVPILHVFTENVHFLYAMPPAAIILAQAMESLWFRLRSRPVLAWMRYALASVLVVIGVDQTLNIYGASRVNRATYRGIDVVADWFVRHVPREAAVVTNVIHGEEIKWHSDSHVELYWTITSGVVDPQHRAVDQLPQLEELLAHRDARPVYFLDVDFDYPPDKALYHRHKYVHQAEIAWRDLGVVHLTHVRYPFADPLRYLIPRMYLPFLGAPDLENDFARKCSVDRPFRHEVYASYHVYEVTGSRLIPKLEGPVQTAQENVDGFNIVHIGLGFHAFPKAEGSFDLDKFRRHGYSVQFSGLTLDSVREQIRGFRRRGGEEEATSRRVGAVP
ncbi:MAG TPA: hypothetical protein VMF69_02295 [Gemmataceae bacterium]|nr:hypothetical protein [Gemmataceae bacterium]